MQKCSRVRGQWRVRLRFVLAGRRLPCLTVLVVSTFSVERAAGAVDAAVFMTQSTSGHLKTRLDPDGVRLWKGTERVSLQPRPLAVLSYPAKRPGAVVADEPVGTGSAQPGAALTPKGHIAHWRRPLLHLTLLAGMALAMFLFQLGTADWEDGVEAENGQVILEMVRGSGWILPLRNARHIPFKPPLFCWLGAGSAELRQSGVDLLDPRLPSAVLGTLCVVFVYLFARQIAGESVALWAGLILVTTPQFIIEARNSRVDIALCTFLTAALFCAHQVWEGNGSRRTAIAAALCIALATLSKGPLAIGLAVMVLGATALVARPRPGWRVLVAPASLAAALVLPMLWYAAATWQHGLPFLRLQFYDENVSRLLGEQGQWPIWFLFGSLVYGGLPWIVALPLGARGASDLPPRTHRFLWIWFAVMFVFFSLTPGKRQAYILPLRPALAVLIAGWLAPLLARRREGRREAPMPRAATVAIGGLALVAVICIIALRYGVASFGASEVEWTYFWRLYLRTHLATALALMVGIGVGLELIVRWLLRRRFELAAYALAGTVAWGVAITVAAASVVRGAGVSMHELAQQISTHVPLTEPLAFFAVNDLEQTSLLFHLRRHVSVALPANEDEPCTPPAAGVYLVREERWDEDACFHRGQWQEMLRGGPGVASYRELRLVVARYTAAQPS